MAAFAESRFALIFAGVLASGLGLIFLLWSLQDVHDSDQGTPPLQAMYLVSGWTCVAALTLSMTRASNGRIARTFLAGACACGALLALPWALLMGVVLPAFVSKLVFSPPPLLEWSGALVGVGWCAFFALLPTAPCIVYGFRARALWRLAVVSEGTPRATAIAALGFVAPLLVGSAAELAFRRLDTVFVERLVYAPIPGDTSSLASWRLLAQLHSWPGLHELSEYDASPTAPPPSERGLRARAAFEALTGYQSLDGDD
jgi:hypothetical protein